MAAAAVWTIGYQGAGIDAVVGALCRAGIELVIDVRAAPVSRRAGFSKRALAATLQEQGIAYRHLKGLGTPKPGRDAARRGEMALFQRIFTAQMATPAARTDLDLAIDLLARQKGCLLCYEHDPAECHRTIVAEAIAARTGFVVEPLRPLVAAVEGN